ncbi:MAG TPA: tRNA uridine-5-carboxymethylaminomethyl(34) synthesis GTPase MnmE [Gemmatimonadales bacterium]|nr:tRNA uridine-5-carboxymethylaminomethyl(34) synthesis GTPase MnmE [Gemmatimonadales bacterium]
MLADPIAALATPPGRSALAVVRLGGDGAFDVASRVIERFRVVPRRATLATFRDSSGEAIDRGIYVVYPRPASYTGEDMVELTCHGGLLVPRRLLAALHAAGARPAHPGEFTRRAVLNGKLDLVQAEAVGDLIDATAPAQARAALRQLDGGLTRRLEGLRSALLELQALLSYDVDFPEEDDGPVSTERLRAALDDVAARIDRLLATAPAAERLREGALVVLAGPPNVGKSSLFNALLGAERALVAEVAGTTRDAIEAHADFLGWPIRLVDTAGLWEAPSPLDRLGVEVSRRYIHAADLVLLCADAGGEGSGPTRAVDWAAGVEESRVLRVLTKADLLPPGGSAGDGAAANGLLPVSALTGQGLDRLRRAVAERVFAEQLALADLEPGLTRERHRVALARAAGALAGARPHLEPGGEPVLAGFHVREATLALDELLGTVDIEDVLARVFANFCVGK